MNASIVNRDNRLRTRCAADNLPLGSRRASFRELSTSPCSMQWRRRTRPSRIGTAQNSTDTALQTEQRYNRYIGLQDPSKVGQPLSLAKRQHRLLVTGPATQPHDDEISRSGALWILQRSAVDSNAAERCGSCSGALWTVTQRSAVISSSTLHMPSLPRPVGTPRLLAATNLATTWTLLSSVLAPVGW